MQTIKYLVYKQGQHYVSQCLNVDVASFGETVEEAINNLKEAVELYFDASETINSYIPIEQVMIGESVVNA